MKKPRKLTKEEKAQQLRAFLGQHFSWAGERLSAFRSKLEELNIQVSRLNDAQLTKWLDRLQSYNGQLVPGFIEKFDGKRVNQVKPQPEEQPPQAEEASTASTEPPLIRDDQWKVIGILTCIGIAPGIAAFFIALIVNLCRRSQPPTAAAGDTTIRTTSTLTNPRTSVHSRPAAQIGTTP